MVEKTCGTPQGQIPEGLRDARLDGGARPRRDDPVCARLDASLDRRADDPHRRDGATAAGQHRHRRRRHERAARALEHPGADRPRADVEPAAGLHDVADGRRAGLRRLHQEARHPAAAAQPAELLEELRRVLRELHEVVVGRRRHRRQQLGLRLSAQARQVIRLAAGHRADGPGQDERLYRAGLQRARVVAEQGEDRPRRWAS